MKGCLALYLIIVFRLMTLGRKTALLQFFVSLLKVQSLSPYHSHWRTVPAPSFAVFCISSFYSGTTF